MSKRTTFVSLVGEGKKNSGKDAGQGEHPTAPPVTALMHTIIGNPENPREESDYTDTDPEFRELKASMKEIGQLQPLAVLSRAVYDQSKPGHGKRLGDAEWIVITGNRRLAAARQLGWTRIDIRVHDRLGGDEEGGQLDEAVVIENIHRKKIQPIKEAAFLRRMVLRHGSQEKVAERIGKSQMYVSHRLALLDLDPQVQQQIETGAVKVSQVRGLSSKPPEEQRARVEQIKEEAAKPKPKRAAKTAPVQNGVLNLAPANRPEPPQEQPSSPAPLAVTQPLANTQDAPETSPDPSSQTDAQPDALPVQRSSGTAQEPSNPEEQRTPRTLPYDDGLFIAQHLLKKMPSDAFEKMLNYLNEHSPQPHG
ncbi:ParB/RepB/Spo0J family partition protein [Streptomyces venezuelae]|uniref:ParB/RepB/Spo0J family partition protein n=1 Tax=Streptomyces venezuelae TaxID=54571 RepID=UPI003451D979